MIAELPDGQTATFRDQLMRGDIREARRGMVFITAPDGSRRTDGAFLDDLTGRIIRIMLVDWSLPMPMPRDAASEDLAQRILDGLDEGTYSALEAAVAPWVNRIITIGKTTTQLIHTAIRRDGGCRRAGQGRAAARLGRFHGR